MSDGPSNVIVEVMLRNIRLQVGTAFDEHMDLFKNEAKAALDAVVSTEHIKRLMLIEAEKFVQDIVSRVFNDYGLKTAVTNKIARSIEDTIKGG